MKVKILGSGAAEGIPALWCSCETCRKARSLCGKDLRRRASYLIDDDILMDFGPDAMWQVRDFQVDLSKVKYLLLTHAHGDHMVPWELANRRPGYLRNIPPLTVCGSRDVISFISDSWQLYGMQCTLSDAGLTPVYLRHNECTERDGLKITALAANHPGTKEAMLFLIERNGKKLLIGNDTGYFPEPTFDALTGAEVSGAILDCTGGLANAGMEHGHMGAATLLKVRDELVQCGGLKKDAVVVANHFSHNGAPLHANLEAYFQSYGVKAGYDGMEFTL